MSLYSTCAVKSVFKETLTSFYSSSSTSVFETKQTRSACKAETAVFSEQLPGNAPALPIGSMRPPGRR